MMKRLRRQEGQAAAETLFSMPIFLLIGVIGFELFGITWNAQYAHVTSRYKVLSDARHKPCKSNNDGTEDLGGSIEATSDQNTLSGDMSPYAQTFAQERSMTNTSYIVCK